MRAVRLAGASDEQARGMRSMQARARFDVHAGARPCILEERDAEMYSLCFA